MGVSTRQTKCKYFQVVFSFKNFSTLQITQRKISATFEVGQQITHPFLRFFFQQNLDQFVDGKKKGIKNGIFVVPPGGSPPILAPVHIQNRSYVSKLIKTKYRNFQKYFTSATTSAPRSLWPPLITQPVAS